MAKNTRGDILNTGIEMWLEDPMSVNAFAIAKRMGLTHGAIFYYFKEVRDAIAEHAIEIKNEKIVGQLIASGHKAANKLTAMERAFYLAKI